MSDALDAVNYITSYTTKHESGHQSNMFRDLKGEMINSSDMFKICIDLLRKREIGMMEIIDMLMGHPMKFSDTANVFINTNAEYGRQRMLKSKAIVEALREAGDIDVNAFLDNWNDQYYPQRHQQLENASLFNVRIHFKTGGKGGEAAQTDDAEEVHISNIVINPSL
jgi:hypothetical protein